MQPDRHGMTGSEIRQSERRAAIMCSPEARGRGPLSEHLAHHTEVSVEEAETLMSLAGHDRDEEAAVEAALVAASMRGDQAVAGRPDGWLAIRMAEARAAQVGAAAPSAVTATATPEDAAEAEKVVTAFRSTPRGSATLPSSTTRKA
jgi:hypothetical protein